MEISPEEEAALTAQLSQLREKQDAQTEVIKALKKDKAPREEVMKEVQKLQAIKADVAAVLSKLYPPNEYDVDSTALAELLKRRAFVLPSFDIYGGSAGLFDLGPPGCAIKANFLQFWRQFFVLEENMLEVDSTCLTPERVLQVSGHTEKFIDVCVRDVASGKHYRADHVIEDFMSELIAKAATPDAERQKARELQGRAEEMELEELDACIKEYGIKSPEGNEFGPSYNMNLMFATQLGPVDGSTAFLRPETAQGIFVNFRHLLDANNNKLPFAGASIGRAFRNEIAPRKGLLRVREFELAEIEYFTFPDEKDHPKFNRVADVKAIFLTKEEQLPGGTNRVVVKTMQEALDSGFIQNSTVGYFLGRVAQFLEAVGIKKFRFRQHKPKEMAHYAQDCWDAEILSSYGWVECVGMADRSCYDLEKHAEGTGQKLGVFREYADGPRTVEVLEAKVNKGTVGKKLKKDAKYVFQYFGALNPDELREHQARMEENGKLEIDTDGGKFECTADMVAFKVTSKKVTGESILPTVIEPSFGVGRIIQCIFEHSYRVREDDEKRGFLSIPAIIAPVKCSILPLISSDELSPFVDQLRRLLTDVNISHKVDDAGQTIGRRYARTDEIGIPYGITIDFQTVKDQTVTLRDRDSTRQVRVPLQDLPSALIPLVNGRWTWSTVEEKFPTFEADKAQ